MVVLYSLAWKGDLIVAAPCRAMCNRFVSVAEAFWRRLFGRLVGRVWALKRISFVTEEDNADSSKR
jgi:hypothetical protein